jgi:hypothetical protein
MTDERLDQVRQLRAQGRSPKQIASALGIRPAEATRLVRAAAARTEAAEPAVTGCWISPTWSTGLDLGDHPGWPVHDDPDVGTGGMVSVLVARRHRYDKVSVCCYLADVYCLGVKNTYGPEVMDDLELRQFLVAFFSAYHSDPIEAPIELARELVWGAVDYAKDLGFTPHPSFDEVKDHLGPLTSPSRITFGKDGKPLYISGPHDNPAAVIRTLERTAGAGNYDYIAAVV